LIVYRDDERIRAPLRRPIAVALLVLAALVAPTWLWFVRGRKLPVRVVVQADRYVAAAGTKVLLNARVAPEAEVQLRWRGPGLDSTERRAEWTLPAEPGVYTAKLTVRRSGSVARDAISVTATPADPLDYPLDLPPERRKPNLQAVAACSPAQPLEVVIRGRRCSGSNLVVALGRPPRREVWFWWLDQPQQAQPGPLANMRLPEAERGLPASQPGRPSGSTVPTLVAAVLDNERNCLHSVQQSVAPESCRGGPRADQPFADFGWRLVGPAMFRFAAKPPRGMPTRSPRYHWKFGDGDEVSRDGPTVTHRYTDGEQHHVVELTLELGDQRLQTLRAVSTRTLSPRGNAGE
jgi:hypothetical protein